MPPRPSIVLSFADLPLPNHIPSKCACQSRKGEEVLANVNWQSATMFSTAKPRPMEWLVDELIPANTVTIISSTSGVGKSVMALHLAICIITGTPWLGLNTRKCKVAYWDQDNPDSVLTENRICAIARGLNIQLSDLPDSWVFRASGPVIMSTLERQQLLLDLKSREVSVLIVDTLASINPVDELVAAAGKVISDGLFPFVNAGITPIVLHHIGKDSIDNRGQIHKRTGIHAPRGSSALVAACGSAFNLMMDGNDRYLECVKPRYGSILPIHINYDEDAAMGLPDWTIRILAGKLRLSQENLTHLIISNGWQNLSSRKVVEMMRLRGLSISQSTAARALSESK